METTPKIIGSAPQLLVPDVTATAEYYRDVLGFSIIGYALTPPVYGMVQRDGFQVHFAKAETALPNKEARKATTDFILWVPEIDAFYAELNSKGADITTEIIQPYGSREFVVRDCNGYTI